MDGRPSASIIIPAHNEARVISRTLETLTAGADPHEFDIVVVCNGCTDDTRAVASSLGHPDVRVLAIEDSSKLAAMNLGDSVARAYPRLYLDADVELSTDGARALVTALQDSQAVVASPVFHLKGCSPLATQYWREWQRRNPHPRAGTGCFGLSEPARTSFGDFPDVLGDDAWVAATFQPEVVDGAVTHIRLARTIQAVLRRRIRIARGNQRVAAHVAELHPGEPARRPTAPARGRPTVGLVVLAGVHASASAWARVRRSGGWSQDQTTRRGTSQLQAG